MWSPSLNGIHVGAIVQISDDHEDAELKGQMAQVQSVYPKTAACQLMLVSTGSVKQVDIQHVKLADTGHAQTALAADGCLDLLLGPRSSSLAVGDVISSALRERGFCHIRVLQEETELQSLVSLLLEAGSLTPDQGGNFGRLASEVEEGYLGRNGRARAMWLSGESGSAGTDTLSEKLLMYDNTLSILAEILQPDCENICGKAVRDRSAALVCLSLPAALEDSYKPPRATNEQLLEFYSTWTRSVLRVLLFFGPEAGTVVLTKKKAAAAVPVNAAEEHVFEAPANTLLILREDCYDYVLEEPFDGESAWMQVLLLEPAAEWNLDGSFSGDRAVLETQVEGPPPPTEEVVAVRSLHLHAGGNFIGAAYEWTGYLSGVDGQVEMPASRFDYRPYYADDDVNFKPMQQTFVRHFSAQEGVELFDHKYFEVSLSEASAMDPMCRQVLEVAAVAMAQMGLTKKISNTKPTHASCSCGNDKQEWNTMTDRPSSVAVNNQLAITANRVNYVFNLKGGSYLCDTACSSSLVAMHLGKRNLLEKRFDPVEFHLGMGTGLTLGVFSFIHSCAAGMLSSSGRCLTFNATASGYNRGDGTGAIMIYRGEHKEDRLALMRGSEMGQDGRSASMSAPNGPAQEKCVWGAIREARMTPPESTVWECHGTGTALGDPIEVGAVRRVQIKMPRSEPLLAVTSKSNLGHLEGAAAIIAMCKCCMVCYHNCCPATLHFRVLNPHLEHAAFDAVYCTELLGYKYRTGHCQVSSFGVGGTNGHAIFWGEKAIDTEVDLDTALLYKVQKHLGKVIVDGPDPGNWHYSGPDLKLEPGMSTVQWTATVERDVVDRNLSVRWERTARQQGALQEQESTPLKNQPAYYAMSGNFNDWSEEQMLEGDVPGLWYANVDVPDNGALLFRLLAEGDHQQAIGPVGGEGVESTSRTAKLAGPGADDGMACWRIDGRPGTLVRVEVLATEPSKLTINWFKLAAT